jgi:hypothetical protein
MPHCSRRQLQREECTPSRALLTGPPLLGIILFTGVLPIIFLIIRHPCRPLLPQQISGTPSCVAP